MIVVATSSTTYWTIALIIGLVAALAVAALLVMLLLQVGRIKRSVEGLLETAGKVGANTANIPQLEATAPVLGEIVDEAVVQDGYMNALTDGYGERVEA
jgi:predicted permease